MRSLGWPRRLAAIAFAGLLLTSCDWNKVGFEVVNRTDRSLTIYYVVEGGRERKFVTALGPGQSVPISGVLLPPDYCTKGDVVARDSAGVEVARRTEPICDGERWVIGTPP